MDNNIFLHVLQHAPLEHLGIFDKISKSAKDELTNIKSLIKFANLILPKEHKIIQYNEKTGTINETKDKIDANASINDTMQKLADLSSLVDANVSKPHDKDIVMDEYAELPDEISDINHENYPKIIETINQNIDSTPKKTNPFRSCKQTTGLGKGTKNIKMEMTNDDNETQELETSLDETDRELMEIMDYLSQDNFLTEKLLSNVEEPMDDHLTSESKTITNTNQTEITSETASPQYTTHNNDYEDISPASTPSITIGDNNIKEATTMVQILCPSNPIPIDQEDISNDRNPDINTPEFTDIMKNYMTTLVGNWQKSREELQTRYSKEMKDHMQSFSKMKEQMEGHMRKMKIREERDKKFEHKIRK